MSDVSNHPTLSPTMRTFLCVLAVLSGVVAAARLAESFEHEELYKKDFVQEYVLAKAVRGHGELYQPMPAMVKQWIDPAIVVNWEHPTPHTPVTAVLSVPLDFVGYPVAAALWLVLELALLAFAWAALFRYWGGDVGWPVRIVLFLLSLSLGPVTQELWFGNLSMVLLALLVAAWFALRSGRDIEGGAWLGLAIAVKLTAWPVILFLLMKRRWSAALAAAVVIAGLHAIAVGVVGFDNVLDYYGRVGPEIARGYRQHDSNYSLWTISGRLFGKTFDSVANNFVALPPWPAPTLDAALKATIPIVGLLVGLGFALRCGDFDSSYGILLCVSLIVNPVAWDHSLLIAAIPIAVVSKRLWIAGLPRPDVVVAVGCFAMAMFPQRSYLKGVAFLTGTKGPEVTFVPFWAGLVTYLPLVALVGWIVLVWRSEALSAPSPPGTPGREGRHTTG